MNHKELQRRGVLYWLVLLYSYVEKLIKANMMWFKTCADYKWDNVYGRRHCKFNPGNI